MDLNGMEFRLVCACARKVTELFFGDRSKGITGSLTSACLTCIQLGFLPAKENTAQQGVAGASCGHQVSSQIEKRTLLVDQGDGRRKRSQVFAAWCSTLLLPAWPTPLGATEELYSELLAWCKGMSRNKNKVFIYLVGTEVKGINEIHLAVACFLNPFPVTIMLSTKSKSKEFARTVRR